MENKRIRGRITDTDIVEMIETDIVEMTENQHIPG